jgi:hypothetical protein
VFPVCCQYKPPNTSRPKGFPLHVSTKLLTEVTLKESSKTAEWFGMLIKRGYYISISYVDTPSLNTAVTSLRSQARRMIEAVV